MVLLSLILHHLYGQRLVFFTSQVLLGFATFDNFYPVEEAERLFIERTIGRRHSTTSSVWRRPSISSMRKLARLEGFDNIFYVEEA